MAPRILLVFVTSLGVASVLFSSAGCGSKPAAPAGPAALTLRVDSALCGPEAVDTATGFVYREPKGWTEATASAVLPTPTGMTPDQWQGRSSGGAERVRAWVSGDGAVVVLSHPTDFIATTTSPTLRAWHRADSARIPGSTLKSTVFTSRGVLVHQLLQMNGNWVRFLMIFSRSSDRPSLALEFWCPRAIYKERLPLLESLAGSVGEPRSR